ncbi:Mediator of RNA polymerase II transcription subunit 25 isoform A [Glycine soja]|uniref:Mediator of RNA polymerase II transcription subunit 25 n=1 Tax=Glycine soja TaxID=3848 RepID=A0A445LMG5_GLYSO|nr:Mediator of RNA polymerase II transcription subunit 25 isoform A [Glycine soja]
MLPHVPILFVPNITSANLFSSALERVLLQLMARFHLWHDTSLAHLPLKFGAILTPYASTSFVNRRFRIFQSPMLRPPLFSVFSKATAFILPLIFWQRTFWLPILSLSPFAHGYLPCGTLNTSLYLGMFPNSQSGDPNQQNVDMHQHCILVAASNPYPLQTPIYVPQLQNLEQSETIDSFPGNRLYDAEAVAKAFPQFSISLSVICPKELPKIKGIYNAGNRNSKAADPPVLAKTPHFLILISEGFREAQGALKVGEGYSNSSESEKASTSALKIWVDAFVPSCSKMAPCNANSSAYISSHMNNKEYVVFQAMNPYGFRGHLEDKKKLLLQRLLFWINRELEIVALLQFLFGK